MSLHPSPRRPLAIEMFCGTFGWSAGWLEMGGRVIGFDIEHLPHHGPVPEGAHLVLQDVLTIDGARFKDADLLLASPPCQAFSWRGMPWKLTKAKHPDEVNLPIPEWWKLSESAMLADQFEEWQAWKVKYPREAPSTALFDACFRIQREASEAAGRHIPMVVENVRSAQRWVGRARGSYGSFLLWGDVPILMPKPVKARKVPGFQFDGSGGSFQTASVEAQKANPDGTAHGTGSWFKIADSKNRGASERATKNEGGSWFAVANNTTSGHSKNPVHEATKTVGLVRRDGHGHTRHLTNQAEHDAVKHHASGAAWLDGAPDKMLGHFGPAKFGSKSSARKAASARIAKIPERLSRYIARYYYPDPEGAHGRSEATA